MSIEMIERQERDAAVNTDTLLLIGGVALVAVGAGLILTSETAKRYMRGMGLQDLGSLASRIVPDIERYFKLRSM